MSDVVSDNSIAVVQLPKQFKDPFYGYIEIERDYVENIIDTPTFQRLKDIRQTSYAPLFPAAHHNRFAHSLGVHYLGTLAFKSIRPQLSEYGKDTDLGNIDSVQKIFELACLLHDVGHAPLSHTGETFYLADENNKLYSDLVNCVDVESFRADFEQLGTNKPAPHECMSCIVGLKRFGKIIGEDIESKDLFARCILGMQIREEKNEGKQKSEYHRYLKTTELRNCIISLLNSSIIDVDRLDYIIRDAGTIGFKSAQVDYLRLLGGMRIVEFEGKFCIGYHKSAISVIEGAVYAHDAEKKWVQSHPAILYESAAFEYAMAKLNNIFQDGNDKNPIFCYDALTVEGKDIKVKDGDEKFHLSLLADEELLHLMKTFCKDEFCHEYFARDRRRYAAWKSEAEYRAIFDEDKLGKDTISKIVKNIDELSKYATNILLGPMVNDSLIASLEGDMEKNEQSFNARHIDQMSFDDVKKGTESKLDIMRAFERMSKRAKIPFDFLIISQNRFSSSFKESVLDIPILIPNWNPSVFPLRKLMPVMQAQEESSAKANYFHVFYRSEKKLSASEKLEIVQIVFSELRAFATCEEPI